MRYDPQRKLKRNSDLYDYLQSHPHDSYAEVGVVFGLSKQRVHQIKNLEEERRKKNGKTPERI